MKEKFWEAMIVILLFALSGVESEPLLFFPIAILGVLAFCNLLDVEIEC